MAVTTVDNRPIILKAAERFIVLSKSPEKVLRLTGVGLQGIQGPIGPQGVKGDTGADSVVPGPQGEQGIQGERGLQGDSGAPGVDGEDGREVEFQKTATHIQQRYVGSSTWNNLVSFTELRENLTQTNIQAAIPDKPGFRTNIGLGNSATLDVGTAAGSVAAGNDSRITDAAQKSANLSDLTDKSAARTAIDAPSNDDLDATNGRVSALEVAGANTASKTGDIIVKGFILDDSSTGAQNVNNVLLQGAINALGANAAGTVIIGVDDGQAEAELWFNDTGRVDQGTRSVTLEYPAVLAIKGSSPVVNRVRTYVGQAEYAFASSQFPLNAGSLNRPPLIAGSLEPLLGFNADVFSPKTESTIARRDDYISTWNDYEGLYGNTTRTSRVYGSSENFAFWDRWTLMTTPVAHDSGTPDASPSEINGALVLHEMNVVNLTRDAANVVSAAVSSFTAAGLSVVPECEDFQNRGFRRGYNMSWSYYVGPSPVPDVDGRHAKTVSPVWIDPNAVAPQGRAMTAGGNDRADPALVSLYGGRGGINSSSADPDSVVHAYLYWKNGIDFTKAVFQGGNAFKLGAGQNVTVENDGASRKVFGEYTPGTVAIAPTALGASVFVTGQNFGPFVFEFKSSYTVRNCWGFVRPEMNEVVFGGEGTTNIHLRISPSGTGSLIVTGLSGRGYANDAAAAAGGIPIDGLYHDALGNVKVRLT